jgi:Holliday junction resolvase RusA-like endonuclease
MKFRLDVEPTAKGRPRTKFCKGRVFTYTPNKTRTMQDIVTLQLNQQVNVMPFKEHEPLNLEVVYYRTPPKKRSESKPCRKPDLVNFDVWLMDCMTGIVYPDDAQIVSHSSKKLWSETGSGYIEINITKE